MRSLFLNSSKIVAIGRKTFAGLSQLEILHLGHNWLEETNGGEFENSSCNLHDNKIFHIDPEAFVNLSSLQVDYIFDKFPLLIFFILQVLFLQNNLLHVFSVWKLSILPTLSIMSVANNPWTFDCSFVQQLQQFLSRLTVMDTTQLDCVDQEKTGYIDNNITCASLSDSVCGPQEWSRRDHHHHVWSLPCHSYLLLPCICLQNLS